MKTKILDIKVIPNSKEEKIIEGNPLKVYVKEPAKKNKANKAVLKLLKEKFKANEIKIISGMKRSKKIVELFFVEILI